MKRIQYLLKTMILMTFTTSVYATEIYSFGITPQASAIQAAKDWTPVLQALEIKTGLKFRFATTRNNSMFSQRIAEETWDFAYLSPDEYVNRDRQEVRYQPIARARNFKLKGIVVVRENSSAEQLEDLNNTTLAVPADAFTASIIPQAVLRHAGTQFSPQTMANQGMAYREVIDGRADASGGTLRSFNSLLPNERNVLRVLWASDGYAPFAITAHIRVPQDVTRRVQEALIDLHLDAQGKKILKTIAPEGLDYAKDEDWNEVRKLGL